MDITSVRILWNQQAYFRDAMEPEGAGVVFSVKRSDSN